MAFFPAPGLSPKRGPQARAAMYLVLLAGLLVLFYRLHQIQFAEGKSNEKWRQQYIVPEPQSDRPDPLAGIEPTDQFFDGIDPAELGIFGDEDPAEANDLRDEGEAVRLSLAYLKSFAPQERDRFLDQNIDYSFPLLMARPEKWRGKPLHFYGILRQKDVQDFPDLDPPLDKMWRLTVHDARQSNFYTILTPQISTSVQINRPIAAETIFLKRYPFWSVPNPMKSGFYQWNPLLVAKRVYAHREPLPPPTLLSSPDEKQQPFPPEMTVEELSPGELQTIARAPKPGPGGEEPGGGSLSKLLRSVTIAGHRPVPIEREVNNLQQEKHALEHLFAYVHGMSREELSRRTDPRMSFERLMRPSRPPEWAEYNVASVAGRALFVDRIRAKGLESGIEQFYVLYAQDARHNNRKYRWAIATLNLPPGLRMGDPVKCDGLFVKFYPYESRKHTWHWCPLVVTPNLQKTTRERLEAPWWGYVLATALLVAVCAGIYYANRRDFERSDGVRQRIRERRAQRDAARVAGMGPARPPSSSRAGSGAQSGTDGSEAAEENGAGDAPPTAQRPDADPQQSESDDVRAKDGAGNAPDGIENGEPGEADQEPSEEASADSGEEESKEDRAD